MPDYDVEVYKRKDKAAGTDGQVQYNNGGRLGGSEIEYDDGTKAATFPDHVYIKAGKRLYFDGT
jgi:hypothetical protein